MARGAQEGAVTSSPGDQGRLPRGGGIWVGPGGWASLPFPTGSVSPGFAECGLGGEAAPLQRVLWPGQGQGKPH